MCGNTFTGLVALSLLLSAGAVARDAASTQDATSSPQPVSHHVSVPATEPVFSNPAKQFQIMGKLKAPAERTVYLPVAQVKWMLHGEGAARGFNTSAYQEVNSPIDAVRIGKIAQALHDDLVAQLEAAGWNVQTRQELGGDVPGYKTASADASLGVPLVKERGGNEFVLVAPTGMPAVHNGGMALASVSMATNSYMRGKPGLNLFVTYGFSTAAIGETKSRMLEMETKPVLTMFGSFNANTSASTAIVNSEGVLVATGIGTLDLTHQTGTATKVLAFVTKQRGIDKKVYDLQPDWDKLEAEAIRGGKAFNTELVGRISR